MVTTIQAAIARQDEATCRSVLTHILSEYGRPAFGALPKREIDLLILEALIRIGYLDSKPSLYQLIQLLRVSRSKARNLVYERDLRRLGETELDEILRESLIRPYILRQGDLYCLEIENPLILDHLKDKLKRLGFATDGSFSPSLVRLSIDAFNALVVDFVPVDNQKAVKDALVEAGAPDGTFFGVVKGVLIKIGAKFADSAGEKMAENIATYLAPILSGATREIKSRLSELFQDAA